MWGQRATPKENDLIPDFKVKCRYVHVGLRPSEPDVYLFPRTAIGYHLQRKEWSTYSHTRESDMQRATH